MTLHPDRPSVKRGYRAPRRQAQAQETREAILVAARRLFLDAGYASTSIKAVARAAAVSEQTIYNAFGDKAALFMAVGDRVLAAQSEAEWMARIRAEEDPVERIRLVARWSHDGWATGLLEFETLLFDAATTDPRLAEVAAQARQGKRATHRVVCELLFPDEVRRPDLTIEEVASLTAALDSSAVVTPLIRHYGWSLEQYERWLVEILVRTFLRPAVWERRTDR